MESNSKFNFSSLITLESLKQFCNQNILDIVAGNLFTINSPVKVRFVDFYRKFAVTGLGRFFFVDDCMYLISTDKKYEEFHNPDISAFFGEEAEMLSLSNNKFITRVIFAGIYTGFDDDKGKRIFTGDVVKAKILTDPDFPAKGKSHRAKNKDSYVKPSKCIAGISEFYEKYSLILDNHRAPLSWLNKVEILGSVFFRLENGTTEVDILSVCNELAQARNNEDYLKLIKKSPYFPSKTWQDKVKEILDIYDD